MAVVAQDLAKEVFLLLGGENGDFSATVALPFLVDELQILTLVLGEVRLVHEDLPKDVDVLALERDCVVAANDHKLNQVQQFLHHFLVCTPPIEDVVLNFLDGGLVFSCDHFDGLLYVLVVSGDARDDQVYEIELLLQVLDGLLRKELGVYPLGLGLEDLDYADDDAG